MPVTHNKVSSIDDPPEDVLAGKIVPSDWNTDHDVLIDLAGPEVTGVLPVDKLPPEAFEVPEMSPSGLVVAHETVFAGKPTQVFTNGQAVTYDGVTYRAEVPADGHSVVQIVAGGLKMTQGTSENGFRASPGDNGGVSILQNILGRSRLLRGGWALWVHLDSWVLAGTTWFYVNQVGTTYPWSYIAGRKTRNTQGGANNANGSLGFWHAMLGIGDTAWAFTANAENPAVTELWHDGPENVLMMYFRSPLDVEWWYGTYSGDWPAWESMKWGHRAMFLDTKYSATSQHGKYRDPKLWGFLPVGGGTGGSTNSITCARWRLTYWNP